MCVYYIIPCMNEEINNYLTCTRNYRVCNRLFGYSGLFDIHKSISVRIAQFGNTRENQL